MTWVELVAATRVLLEETDGANSHWSNASTEALLTGYVKRAEQKMIEEAEANIAYALQNIVVGTSEATATYTLPTDSLRIMEIRVAGEDAPLACKIIHDLQETYGTDWRSETGTALYYYMASTLAARLVPMPTAAVTNGLAVTYVKLVSQAGSSPAGISLQLHEYLPYYAAMLARESDGANRSEMGLWIARFEQGVALCRRMMRPADMVQTFSSGLISELAAYRENL